jgi:hypothetical protein
MDTTTTMTTAPATSEGLRFLLGDTHQGLFQILEEIIRDGGKSRLGIQEQIQPINNDGRLAGFRYLAAGRAQFIFQDIGSLIALRARDDMKIKAVCGVYQKPPHTAFYIKGRGITKPIDFQGRKLATSAGSSRSGTGLPSSSARRRGSKNAMRASISTTLARVTPVSTSTAASSISRVRSVGDRLARCRAATKSRSFAQLAAVSASMPATACACAVGCSCRAWA